MNKKAILNLANLLENIPPETGIGFNMDTYNSPAEDYTMTNVNHPCDTVACIAGWASYFMTKSGEDPQETRLDRGRIRRGYPRPE